MIDITTLQARAGAIFNTRAQALIEATERVQKATAEDNFKERDRAFTAWEQVSRLATDANYAKEATDIEWLSTWLSANED